MRRVNNNALLQWDNELFKGLGDYNYRVNGHPTSGHSSLVVAQGVLATRINII